MRKRASVSSARIQRLPVSQCCGMCNTRSHASTDSRNWKELKLALQNAAAGRRPKEHTAEDYQHAAQDFVNAYEGDAAALQRLNQHYRRSFSFEDLRAEIWRRVYAFRQRSFQGAEELSAA